MSDEAPTLDTLCPCGGTFVWESRETYRDRRWFGICSDPECGQVRIEPVSDLEQDVGLEFFLLDRPPLPYKPPYVRFFVQATRLMHWCAADQCWDCSGSITFKTGLALDLERVGDPCEVHLCLPCGATEVSFWAVPRLSRLRVTGSAWETLPVPIVALKRTLQDRMAARDGSGWND
jgi:hypothetical protein